MAPTLDVLVLFINVFSFKKAFCELKTFFRHFETFPKMFPVGKKQLSSLMNIPSGIFRRCEFGKIFTRTLCLFKILGF